MRSALVVCSFLGAAAALHAAPAGVRSVFLNGVDISSAKSQDLKNVDIHINEVGDVFIIAPHYQVNEEDTYVPLSKYVQGLNQPEHKPPMKIGGDQHVGAAQHPPEAPLAKAGEPLSPPAQMQQALPGAPVAAGAAAPGGAAEPVPAANPALGIPKAGDAPPGLPDEDAAPAPPAEAPTAPPEKPLGG